MIAKGNVEMWLGSLLETQQKSVHAVIREAYHLINDPTFEILGFISSYVAQVCHVSSRLSQFYPVISRLN